MPYQDSTYLQGSLPEAPPTGPPLLWISVLDDLQLFFDELGGPVQETNGADQNSYYNDPSDSAPLDPMFLQEFGWMNAGQNVPGAHYFDYLTSDVDSEFLLSTSGVTAFDAVFSGGHISVQKLSDGNTYGINLNGLTMFATWHPGSPGSGDNDLITVVGGHWTFLYTGFDVAHYGGNAPPSPPPSIAAPSADALAARADPEGIANQHIQTLRAQLHAVLDQHDGHWMVQFHGPNGTEYFDLADLVYRLDHYHIHAVDGSLTDVSGGAGFIHPDGHGGWETDITRDQLVGYETQAYHLLDFMILHEVAHVLPNGTSFSNSQWWGWLAANPGGTEATYHGNGMNGVAAFWQNESYANNMAVALESLVGLAPPQHVAGGFDYAGVY